MKKYLLILFITSFNSFAFGQKCNIEKLTYLYIKESLVSDIYFFLDFDKEKIPEAKIYFFNEIIPINYKNFEIDKCNLSSKNFLQNNLDFLNIGNSKDDCNYVLFHSVLENNTIMFEIFFNRADFFNIQGKTLYDTWRRNNSGISYLFIFNENSCWLDIKKKPISYD